MSERFYNPYQFIPVDTRKTKQLTAFRSKSQSSKNQAKGNVDEDVGLDRPSNQFVRHDYWHKAGCSGRIRCHVTSMSPLVVGAEQTLGVKADNQPGEVTLYQIPDTTNPEGANGKQYAIPGNSLRGMIGSVTEVISQSSLRVLHSLGEGDYSIRKPVSQPLKKLGLLLKEGDRFFILPLADLRQEWSFEKVSYRNDSALINSNDTYQHEHNSDLVAHKGQKGVLYIRGKVTSESNKENEYFIPWKGVPDSKLYLDVPETVVHSLDRVLKSRFEDYKKSNKGGNDTECKLWPKGYFNATRMPENGDEDSLIVLSGDILYYGVKSGEVTELSYSAIWRKVVKGDVFQSFKKFAGDNALPWNADRTDLTPAEALFGVVEENPNKLAGARNLASRIRFSDATATKKVELEPEVTLKILNSPKPPSPAMYFSAKGGQYIPKNKLDLTKHAPNGRKYYIPHQADSKNWVHNPEVDSERNHMRLSCQPIKSGACFQFDIHFENLSVAELGLLRTALQPAGVDQSFIHRLGLGKPYGLGQVSIDQVEISLIDRRARYKPSRFLQDSPYQDYNEECDLSLVDVESALPTLLAMANQASYDDLPVCYPFDRAAKDKRTHQSKDSESDGFQWFVENDRKNGREDFLHFGKNISNTGKNKSNSANKDKVMKPLSSGKTRAPD